MRKYLFAMLLILLLAVGLLVGCGERKKTSEPEGEVSPQVTVLYDKEVAEEKYLKERVSDATAIYYKSNEKGEYGDENALFERTILPAAYTELDHIRSTGAQSIDTGVLYSDTLTFDLKFSDYITAANGGGIFGTEGRLFSLSRSAAARLIWCAEEAKSNTYNSFSPYRTYEVQCGKDQLVVNGTNVIKKSDDTKSYGKQNIILFKTNKGYSSLKLYYFKIYDEETIVRNYIPCYRNYDAAVGLYDLVGGRFYCNQTESISSEDVDAVHITLPEGYRQVEYIESTGKQRMPLNIIPQSSYTIEATFAMTNLNYNSAIWCSKGAGWYNAAYYIKGSELRYDYGTSDVQKNVGRVTANVKHTLRKEGEKVIVDGISSATFTAGEFACQSHLQLFASHNNEVNSEIGNYARLKMYAFGVYQADGTPLLYLVPCYGETEETAGMYDVINDYFYTGTVTEPFKVGETVTETDLTDESLRITAPLPMEAKEDGIVLPSGYRRVLYVEGTGTQYFDTGITVDKGDQLRYETLIQYTSVNRYFNGANACLQFVYEYYKTLEPLPLTIEYDGAIETIYRGDYKVRTQDFSDQVVLNTKLYVLAMGIKNKGRYTTTAPQSGRVYQVRLTKDDELVLDCLPCIRESDGEAGLYDLVTDTFLANAGTGDVLYGEEICNIPHEYELVDFIEYSGEQEVVLPVEVTEGMVAEITLSCDSDGAVSYPLLTIGDHVSLRVERDRLLYDAFGGKAEGIALRKNLRYNLTTSFDSEKALGINDIIYGGTEITYASTAAEVRLFGRADALTGIVKAYRIRLSDGDSLLCNLVPCTRKYDGKAGWYDTVSDAFYPSVGTDFGCRVSFAESRVASLYEEIEGVLLDEEHYLDLDYIGDTEFILDVRFDAEHSSGTFGYINDDLAWSVGAGKYSFGSGEIAIGQRDVLSDKYGTNVIRTLNGTVVQSIPSLGEIAGVYRVGNAWSEPRRDSAMTLYGLQVKQGGVLVLDLRPVRRRSDGSIGMIDRITDIFYPLYNNKKNLAMGEAVGHRFDETRVISEASERHGGEVVHVCGICGAEIADHTDAHAFEVTFSYGTGVKEIRVYKGYDFSSYETADVAYTRNKNTNNFSRVDGQVYFEVILEEGYEVSKIYAEGSACSRDNGNVYLLSSITGDLSVYVLPEKTHTEE